MKQNRVLFKILSRYSLVLLLGLENLYLFYNLLSFPTIYVSNKILSFLGESSFVDNYIIFNDAPLQIANACVSGAAYYFLFFLSMSIPLIFPKRIKVIFYSWGLFYVSNVIRIVFMALILQESYFNLVHLSLWHIFSTILVIVIWFSAVKIFKVKEIPIYTDYSTIKKTYKALTKK